MSSLETDYSGTTGNAVSDEPKDVVTVGAAAGLAMDRRWNQALVSQSSLVASRDKFREISLAFEQTEPGGLVI